VGENMLMIHPDECIDCGLCEPECPAEAILPDTDQGAEPWLQLNRDYSAKWPNITQKGEPPPDAESTKAWRTGLSSISVRIPGSLHRSVVWRI
jgi:ferredoxin